MPINFKEYVQESKSLELTTDERSKVTELTKKYIELFTKDTKTPTYPLPQHFFKDIKIKKHSKLTPRFLKLDTLQLVDRSTKTIKSVDVIVILDYPDPPFSGLYREETEEILLFHNALIESSYYRIFEIISHEVIHAIQHYRTVSAEYIKAVKKDIHKNTQAKKAYYTEPLEFEATLSGVLSQLKELYTEYITRIETYNKSDDKTAKVFLLRKLNFFLKSLKVFATSTPETYFKYSELPIPLPLREREDFFITIQEDLRYKRKYQQAILNFVLDAQMHLLEMGIELDL
jgi:hypothetical protein